MSSLPKDYLKEFQFSEIFKFDLSHIKGDLVGGLTSAVVALPLALGFGIFACNGDTQEYLQTLSLLAKSLKKPGLIERLRTIQSEYEMFDLLAHELDAT